MKNNPDVVGLFYDLCVLCKKNAMVSDALDYSAKISQAYTIEQERNLHLEETEKVIKEIGNKKDVHQLRAYLKHQPANIRYFILERAMVIMYAYMEEPDFLPAAEIQGEPCQKLSQGLLVLWKQFLDFLSAKGSQVNSYLSMAILKSGMK